MRSRAHGGSHVERELEVGGVLLVRMSLHAGSGGLGHLDGFRRRGVEVAHRDRHLEAERERVLESLVRRDDGCTEWRGQARARIRRLSARHHHDDLFRHAFLRWHYPDQVLRVGGASVRPLSPAARAPRYVSCHRSLHVARWEACVRQFYVMVNAIVRVDVFPAASVAVTTAV